MAASVDLKFKLLIPSLYVKFTLLSKAHNTYRQWYIQCSKRKGKQFEK